MDAGAVDVDILYRLGAMFSWNFERRLQQIEEKGSFWDETGNRLRKGSVAV